LEKAILKASGAKVNPGRTTSDGLGPCDGICMSYFCTKEVKKMNDEFLAKGSPRHTLAPVTIFVVRFKMVDSLYENYFSLTGSKQHEVIILLELAFRTDKPLGAEIFWISPMSGVHVNAPQVHQYHTSLYRACIQFNIQKQKLKMLIFL